MAENIKYQESKIKKQMAKDHRERKISPETIKRLSIYLRNLKKLKDANIEVISSHRITKILNVTPAQFRKDLSYFGGFGKRGVGYNVGKLIQEIENILGVNKKWNIIIAGVGKLGSALLGFEGFRKFNIKITHAFDIDKEKIGKIRKGVEIEDIKKMKSILKRENIKIAIISTFPSAAQSVADDLVKAGIRGILNFTPVILKLPEYVAMLNVDMACELESLIFRVRKNKF